MYNVQITALANTIAAIVIPARGGITYVSASCILPRLAPILVRMLQGAGSVIKKLGNVETTSRLLEQIKKLPLKEVGDRMTEMTSDLSESKKQTMAVLCLLTILAKAYDSINQGRPSIIDRVIKKYSEESQHIMNILNTEVTISGVITAGAIVALARAMMASSGSLNDTETIVASARTMM